MRTRIDAEALNGDVESGRRGGEVMTKRRRRKRKRVWLNPRRAPRAAREGLYMRVIRVLRRQIRRCFNGCRGATPSPRCGRGIGR